MFSSRHRIVTPKIIQADSGGKSWWWLLLLLIIVVVWSWYVFDYGRIRAGADIQLFEQEIDQLESKIDQQKKKIAALRLQSATYQRAAQVDKTSAREAMQNIRHYQQEMAELRREVDFLNGLLSDKAKKAIIVLKQMALTSSEKNVYNLEFTLVHLTKVNGSAKGSGTLTLSGELNGKNKSLKLAELTADKMQSFKLGFKNFQKIETSLRLPDNFIPQSLTIETDLEGKTIEKFKQTLPWVITGG